MTRKYFGTDGIRGKANVGVMTPETAFRLGAAVTYHARMNGSPRPRIVIGKDTRRSGYLFESALTAGCSALGGDVQVTGPLPTPAIAHITMSMRADFGVVISASHNAYQDNGLKLFGPDGFKLPDELELELEALMDSDVLDTKRATGQHIGMVERIDSAWGRYVQFVKSTFPSDLTLEGLRIVIDAAHGAAYMTAPAVFTELGATVYPLGVHPNGHNINADRGAMHPGACAKEVLRRKADIGFALDGDADRVVVVDERGRVVNGDAIMALCATRMLRRRELRKRTLVTTVMSSLGLEQSLKREKGKMLRVDVGDRYVVEAMRRGGYSFGGEQSGHLVFLDHATTGDGLLGALQVLAILLREERPLSELIDETFEPVPQVLISTTLPVRRALEEMPDTQSAIRDAEAALAADGRVLVRWSGTEPKLRVLVEGTQKRMITKLANQITKAAKSEIG